MSRRKEPAIPAYLLDQLLTGTNAATALDQGGLLDSLKKALAERALNAEMDHHLCGEAEAGNNRNGFGRKTVIADSGKIEIDAPCDRAGSFNPQLIAKYQRRFPGFDDKIVSMSARGMSTREITRHLRDLYGIDVSPDPTSTVTDTVLEEVAAWQARPLDPAYPLVFFAAIRVKIRDEGMVRKKAIHIALSVRADGHKEVLGLWIEQNEGAKFWLRVINELRNRGTEDIMLAVVDGLKGFPDAVRKILYTTNAIEALNSKLRRAVRARGHSPSDDAATKLLYLILNRSEKEWKMPPREWSMAKAQFAVIFG